MEDLLERVSLVTSSDSSLASFAAVTSASLTWGSCRVQRFVAKELWYLLLRDDITHRFLHKNTMHTGT